MHLGVEIALIEGNPRARATERKTRADHCGQANLRQHFPSLGQALDGPTATGLQTAPLHRGLKELSLLSASDDLSVGADHLHAVLFEDPAAGKIHGQVEPGLPTQRGQDGVGFLDLDHLLQHLPGQRLDVGAIRRARIGHDRGRIRIDQHYPIAILTESLAGLGAGIIKLTGLADHNRPRPNKQYRVKIVAAWHEMRNYHPHSARFNEPLQSSCETTFLRSIPRVKADECLPHPPSTRCGRPSLTS